VIYSEELPFGAFANLISLRFSFFSSFFSFVYISVSI
jgi:hypothetical protein